MKTTVQLELAATVSAAPRIDVAPVAGFVGDSVTLSVFNIPAGVKNWIAEVPRGQLWVNPMRWQYLPNGQVQAVLNFNSLLQGEWEYLLYLNDSVNPADIVARSQIVVMAPAANRDPVWIGALVEFVDGVAGAAALTSSYHVTDLDGDLLTFSVVAPFDANVLRQELGTQGLDPTLAAGFAFDPSTFTLSYDGRPFNLGAVEMQPASCGLRLSADDGRP